MARLPELPQEFLHSVLSYCAKTGTLRWKERTPDMFEDGARSAAHRCAVWNANYAHQIAGGLSNFGYRRILLHGKLYLAHVIAWAMHYGQWPEHEIDHKKGSRDDNRIAKLRKATRTQNEFNKRRQSNNSSGVPGVVFHKPSGLWTARTMVNRKWISGGYFLTKEEAIEARAKLVAEHHGEFAVDDLERAGYGGVHS